CRQCTIGCGRIVQIDDGEYKTPGLVDGPEYETVGSFGACLLCSDLKAISYANFLCNQYGMDTISTGVTIGFAYYLQEKGVLTPGKVDGLKLKWGEIDGAIELVHRIARREGVGDLLSGGVVHVAKTLGISLDEAAAVNGLEIPFHDPRAYFGSALEYVTSHRGACHQTAQYYLTSMGAPFPDVGINCIDRFEDNGVGECVARLQDLRAIYQSMSMCNFIVPSSVELIAKLFSAATGIDMDKNMLIKCGERINVLRRLINLKLGYNTKNEKLPAIMLRSLDGGTEGKIPDVERQLKDYYTFRGWNRESGRPSPEKIRSLELEDLPDIIMSPKK
ncbi:MAG: aldehyde ferredoxin oxidoreductase C-terminal domain-containing protein, partial [Promethearchaeota archaeon]